MKADNFYDIQDAVSFNIPVNESDPFYTDFLPFRTDFHDEKIFKHLAIDYTAREQKCNSLKTPKKIFLSGYRGTGKTSELLKLTNKINKTKCYFSIFVDISEEELDTSNIETVDILILMLEKLIEKLKQNGANVSSESISDFYEWYKTKIIEEINKSVTGSAQIEIGVDTGHTLLKLFGLIANTKAKLHGSQESKKTIRREINNNFQMFGRKFNEFIASLVSQFRDKNHYQDILFIVDGFEKIGSLRDRRKILIDDANKFEIIKAHMIITLPIELFTEKNRLNHFATTENFPLIDLNKSGAKERFREFILKRVDEKLFENGSIEKIIEFGAGHPRQTLQIINRAYVEAEGKIIDIKSVEKAIAILGGEMSKVTSQEIEILKKVEAKEIIPKSDIYTNLKSKNIIFEYNSSSESNIINPIVKADDDFQKHLNQQYDKPKQ